MPTVTDIAIDYGSGAIGGVAPQFVSLSVEVLQEHLDRAVVLHSEGYFGTSFDHAMALYAAHTLAHAFPELAQNGASAGNGTGGAVASKKAGDLSITYGATAVGGVSPTGDPLDSTTWGQQFKAIRRMRRRAPRFVR